MNRPEYSRINTWWSMDFVCDQLFNGNRFRALTLVDNFIRKCLLIHPEKSIKGDEVVEVLVQLKEKMGLLQNEFR
jgi:putative transposase